MYLFGFLYFWGEKNQECSVLLSQESYVSPGRSSGFISLLYKEMQLIHTSSFTVQRHVCPAVCVCVYGKSV